MSEFVFKKKYGQNFLSDQNLLRAIVADAGVDGGEVLEIGAGAGSLTRALAEKAQRVVAFEIDKDLESTLKNLNLSNVQFVFEDFMKREFSDVEKMFDGTFKVVANLPYYLTTPIIFRILEEGKNVESVTVMVQKEVAEKFCAKVGQGDYGIPSVVTEIYGSAKIMRVVKRQMFYPVPNVDSAILKIDIDRQKFAQIDKPSFARFVRRCFAMRRKTLLNNLASFYSKETLQKVLSKNMLSSRAETLTVEQFFDIFCALEREKTQKA